MPLCGFVARCDALFTGVDDRLYVRALAVESRGHTVVILSYDLLALGSEISTEIITALDGVKGADSLIPEWILCATHTHSAPAAITLLGCGSAQDDYRDQVVAASRAAGEAATGNMRPARLRWTTVQLAEHSYNRRRVLEDGRVVMARYPDAPVKKTGPTLKNMLLARFDGEDGTGIAGIVSWAAHGVTVCGPNVTADFPGELCRRLTEQNGIPFLYLQGACGNINPFFKEMTRKEMLANTDAIIEKASRAVLPDEPAHVTSRPGSDLGSAREPDEDGRLARRTVFLTYDPLPTVAELRDMQRGMEIIAGTGDGPENMSRIIADILNVEPGKRPDRRLTMHIASTLRDWSKDAIRIAEKGGASVFPLGVAVWRLGGLVFCFVAAEVFAETVISLQRSFPDEHVIIVGYMGGPMAGYLPTDEALEEGGYEVTFAYRFWNHPAPFTHGSEGLVRATLEEMIRGFKVRP